MDSSVYDEDISRRIALFFLTDPPKAAVDETFTELAEALEFCSQEESAEVL